MHSRRARVYAFAVMAATKGQRMAALGFKYRAKIGRWLRFAADRIDPPMGYVAGRDSVRFDATDASWSSPMLRAEMVIAPADAALVHVTPSGARIYADDNARVYVDDGIRLYVDDEGGVSDGT